MARAHRARRRAVFIEYDYKIENGELWIKAGQMPTLASLPSQAGADKPKRCTCA